MTIPAQPVQQPWPPFPPATGLPKYFTPKKSDFTDLVSSTLGNSASDSDGWDVAFAAWSAAITEGDTALAGLAALESAIEGPAADILALGDDLEEIFASGIANALAAGSALASAIGDIGELPSAPEPWDLPGLPALASFAAPATEEVASIISELVQAAIQPFEQQVESQMNSIMYYINQLLQGDLAAASELAGGAGNAPD